MKRRILVLTLVLVIITSLLGARTFRVRAGSQPPPARNMSQRQSSQGAAQRGAAPALSPQATLGQPGLSFRYVQTFGVSEEAYPADTQHLYNPNGLFTDDSGSLYVVEWGGSRLLKYRLSDGAHQLTIGTPGVHWVDWTVFSYPEGAALDSANNIWVADDSRVTQFDASGSYLQQFPAMDQEPWACYADNGHFCNPQGIDFDSSGRLYISDTDNHRIQVFSMLSGTPVYSTTIGISGESGSNNAHFDRPGQIAFDSQGRLYVADMNNYRIQRCSYAAGWTCATFHGETGNSGSGTSQLGFAYALTIDSSDRLFIADGGNGRIKRCSDTGSCVTLISGYSFIAGVAVDGAGNIYLSESDVDVVHKHASNGTYVGVFLGTSGVPYVTDTTRMNFPRGVAVAPDGSIYVAEELGYRLLKLDADGNQQWTVGQPGVYGDDIAHFGDWWAGLQASPALDAAGRVYVPDHSNQRVQIFNSDSSYFDTLGITRQAGDDQDHFDCPAGVAISPVNGDLYVADTCNQRIQVFDSNLAYKDTLGLTDVFTDTNQGFNLPYDVAVDSLGYVYVADSKNHRVQVFDSSLVYQRTLGVTGECGDDFDHLCGVFGVAVDSARRLYVADSWNNRIQVFDASGGYLTTIGGEWGSETGQLRSPFGVEVDGQGSVYVADGNNHRVQKYARGVPGWAQVNINGFGDRRNEGVTALEVFGGQLYAGTAHWGIGGQVWRSNNGVSWAMVSEPGFSNVYGNTNAAVIDLIEFDNQLYASTGWTGNPGQIWRSSDGEAWDAVESGGFEDANNTAFSSFAIYGGSIYAGAENHTDGFEIWRSPSGNPGSWTNVASGGLGFASYSQLSAFTEFNGDLYIATVNTDEAWAAKIWRSSNGEDWTPVTADGFGVPHNISCGGLAVFEGDLYVAFRNLTTGTQIFRSSDGEGWAPVVTDGFGDTNNEGAYSLYVFEDQLYATVWNPVTGTEVWRTPDGVSWSQVNPNGFGDSNNLGSIFPSATVEFKDLLHISTWNYIHGGEVWQLQRSLYIPTVLRQTPAPPPVSTWRSLASPTTNKLNAISMVSATDGWAVGDEGVILRWNGSAWGSVTSPSTANLLSVSMASANDGWIAAADLSKYHWDGASWTPVAGGPALPYYAVSALPSNAWLTGGYMLCSPACDDLMGFISRWNGAAWSTSYIQHDYFNAIDMVSTADGWSVGDVMFDTTYYAIARWDGSNWASFPHPLVQSLTDVSASDASNAWTVGYDHNYNCATLRWNGSAWSLVTCPASWYLKAVATISGTDAWAVGTGGLIAHTNGSAWSQAASPVATNLNDVAMLSATQGWAVGDSGVIVRYSP